MSAPPQESKIITFYSYKGGTGRSMALANVAWILASQGQRVLVVDWDLEAPGLHRYFHPFLLDKDLTSSRGVIDLVWDFATEALTPVAEADRQKGWHEKFADIRPYAVAVRWKFNKPRGRLDLVPAGRQGPGYAARVNSFNWRNFYDRLGGGVFLNAVAANMRRHYDYVLIDSRTGVSDTSGICTVQLPDTLVVLHTANTQSVEGAAAVAASVHEQWQALAKQALARQKTEAGALPTIQPPTTPPPTTPPPRPRRILPVLTRVELGEKDKLEQARKYARARFEPYLDHLTLNAAADYWGRVETLYVPWYAYEEMLAPFADDPYESNSVLAAAERLTSYLTDGAVHKLDPIDDTLRAETKAAFLRGSSSASAEAPAFDVYVSYSRKDGDWVSAELVSQLEKAGLKIFIDYQNLQPGDPWMETLERAIRSSRHIVAVLTPNYLQSKFVHRELEIAGRAGTQTKIVPVMLAPVQPPEALASLAYADFTDLAQRPKAMQQLVRSLGGQPTRPLPTDADEAARDVSAAAAAGRAFEILRDGALDQLETMTVYKQLHDTMHELELQCYLPLLEDNERLTDSEETRRTLLEKHEFTLAHIIDRLEAIVVRMENRQEHERWMTTLLRAHTELRSAAGGDFARVSVVPHLIGHILKVQPAAFNARILLAANNLRLGDLVQALTELSAHVQFVSADPRHLQPIQASIMALADLDQRLHEIVQRHDRWQRVADESLRIQDFANYEVSELALVWQDLSDIVKPLLANQPGTLAAALRMECQRLDELLATTVIAVRQEKFRLVAEKAANVARRPEGGDAKKGEPARRGEVQHTYHRFRRLVMEQFYRVDQDLLRLCDSLRNVISRLTFPAISLPTT